MSASHNIQAGNDLFVGKDEAYIMNRKKKEKSVLRKEGNVYVLGSFIMMCDTGCMVQGSESLQRQCADAFDKSSTVIDLHGSGERWVW